MYERNWKTKHLTGKCWLNSGSVSSQSTNICAKDILLDVEVNENYLWKSIFDNEALFYTSRRVNHHSWRIWGSENPHIIQEIVRDSAEVDVLCMLSCSEILGPFIFVEQAVTWMTFLDMLRMYLLSHLKSHQLNVFQQYGGPPYRVRSIRNFFTWHFPER